jgi:pimeloyl-ACP methyl ester carboxylesterase
LVEALTPAGRPKPTEDQIKALNKLLLLTNDAKALAGVVRGWKELKVSDDKLKANHIPTLALIGEFDPLKKYVDDLRGNLSNLEIRVIPGADHMNAFVQKSFINHLKQFLDDHSNVKERQLVPATSRPR